MTRLTLQIGLTRATKAIPLIFLSIALDNMMPDLRRYWAAIGTLARLVSVNAN
jgi:hypothetical protein